mmetsp:Transcript_21283/g.59230  ORF Transcript_21283/g.59230 Transcript_21283/m.59230 type:complete len:204 (-) Transcript_21283:1990-2601(-)
MEPCPQSRQRWLLDGIGRLSCGASLCTIRTRLPSISETRYPDSCEWKGRRKCRGERGGRGGEEGKGKARNRPGREIPIDGFVRLRAWNCRVPHGRIPLAVVLAAPDRGDRNPGRKTPRRNEHGSSGSRSRIRHSASPTRNLVSDPSRSLVLGSPIRYRGPSPTAMGNDAGQGGVGRGPRDTELSLQHQIGHDEIGAGPLSRQR